MRNTASPFYLLILWLLVSNVRAQQWVRTLDGGALGDDQAFSVVTTLDDDVIVTGQVDLGTHRCGAIAKYSSDGELVWLTPYDPFPGYTSGLGYIVAAPSGELYATASCRDSSDIQVAAVVKFSPGGALLHEFRYSHPDHLLDSPRALSFDGLGNILFLCRSQTNADRDDALLVKCDSACQPLWMTRYNLEGGRDTPMGLAVDSVGNAYVAGSGVTGSFSVTVGTFIKVAPNGDTLWTYVDGTPGEVTEFLQAAVSHDKIYAIGYRSIGRARALTMRFTGDGDTLWTKERTEGTSRAAAAVDTFGVVHTDMAEDSAATADMRTFAYSCNGSLRWVSR